MHKRLLTLFLFFTLFSSHVKSQYVTISDTGMVNWLTVNYSSAMVGNQMDTTDTWITSVQVISLYNLSVSDLFGIQFFDNATTLLAANSNIQFIPAFPPNLIFIDITHNNISVLPPLPNGLLVLSCSNNQLQNLPNLPSSLYNLHCSNNQITQLPVLPTSLISLACDYNNLNTIPILPPVMETLSCGYNNLSYLPVLSNSLTFLFCSGNSLTQLPLLPNGLADISCVNNDLISLPLLPDSLVNLECDSNNLTTLPTLPSLLNVLSCRYNYLTILPDLPNNLGSLYLDNNYITCLPILPQSLLYLYMDSVPVSCLPNYPQNLTFTNFPVYPLCIGGNPNGCISNNSISGAVFYDSNNNCINNLNLSTPATFHLYDDQNNFLQSRSSSFNDNYYFDVQAGNYKVKMDSSFFTTSVAVNCPVSGEHVVSAVQDSSYTNRDFGVACLGVDVGVEAIVQEGIVFPGQPHSVNTILGDLSHYLGLNCASGTGGTVQINVTGPISYTGYPTTALAPIVNGNSYSYTITDFGAISLDESFVLNFLTDTTAQAGNSILVTATITSDSLDLDSTNNSLSYTYFVVNSYDPNMKEVNPVNVLPGYEDYFTYTVHFQNLGSAPAFNIRIKDTIDGNLNLQTLRVINASHDYYYNLSGDLLTVHFPNIMLADSASNPEGSKGFIQYQVKPKPNLPLGTIIENTAHIYFDFNPAVVTNTTTNTYVETLSLAEKDQEEFFVYPNPSSGQFTIVGQNIKNELVKVQVCDLTGKVWKSENLNFKNGSASLQTDLASGSYILILETASGRTNVHRLMIRN